MKHFAVILLVLASAGLARADALANPARYCSANRVTAGAASSNVVLDRVIASPSTPSPATVRCQSIVIINEDATNDAYVNIESTTAAATDGLNSLNVRIKAGKTFQLDVRAPQISFIRAGAADVTLNIVAIY